MNGYSKTNYYNIFLKTKYPKLDVEEMINKFESLNWTAYEENKK